MYVSLCLLFPARCLFDLLLNTEESVSPKRPYTSTRLHGVTSPKTVFALRQFVLRIWFQDARSHDHVTLLQVGVTVSGVTYGAMLGLFSLGMFFPWANTKVNRHAQTLMQLSPCAATQQLPSTL